nr:hypothetical protein [Acidobacteriota bacterium]
MLDRHHDDVAFVEAPPDIAESRVVLVVARRPLEELSKREERPSLSTLLPHDGGRDRRSECGHAEENEGQAEAGIYLDVDVGRPAPHDRRGDADGFGDERLSEERLKERVPVDVVEAERPEDLERRESGGEARDPEGMPLEKKKRRGGGDRYRVEPRHVPEGVIAELRALPNPEQAGGSPD